MSYEGNQYADGSYRHATFCSNCRSKNTFSIPKGVTIAEFMSRQKCFHCGCRIVQPEYKYREPDAWMRADEVSNGTE